MIGAAGLLEKDSTEGAAAALNRVHETTMTLEQCQNQARTRQSVAESNKKNEKEEGCLERN